MQFLNPPFLGLRLLRNQKWNSYKQSQPLPALFPTYIKEMELWVFIIRSITVSERKVNFPFLNFQNILYLLLVKKLLYYFKKARTTNLHCHWTKSPWRRVEKGVFWFLNIDKQKKRKQKYTFLFINYVQTAFLKATKPLQFDVMSGKGKPL